jgi:hypothetical protein
VTYDHVITLLAPSEIDDGYQKKPGHPTTYLADVPVAAKAISDGERFRGGELAASLTWRFTAVWTPEIAAVSPTFLVLFEGVTYGIAGVKPVGRRAQVEITACAFAGTSSGSS